MCQRDHRYNAMSLEDQMIALGCQCIALPHYPVSN